MCRTHFLELKKYNFVWLQVFEHENAQLCSLCYAKLPLVERRKIDKKKREEEAIAKYYAIKEQQEKLKAAKKAKKGAKKKK